MKVIIAGSRGITSLKEILNAIEEAPFPITELVCGMAKGVDMASWAWAYDTGIPIKEFKANWTLHGRAAGAIRNVQMAEYAEALIAIWDGKSVGTSHMIDTAQDKGLKVFVKIVAPNT